MTAKATARLLATVLGAALALAGCKKEESALPIVGVYAAADPVLLQTNKNGKQPIIVGSFLRAEAKVTATGPAVLEFYGGAFRFLEKDETLEVGEAIEAAQLSPNLPQKRIKSGEVTTLPMMNPIVAARYDNLRLATDGTTPSADYFRTAYAPDGTPPQFTVAAGPPRPLPAKERKSMPKIHAADLGAGGAVAQVLSGYVVGEGEGLSTAVLLKGRVIELGHTTRLIVPPGARVKLTFEDQSAVELSGPADYRLR